MLFLREVGNNGKSAISISGSHIWYTKMAPELEHRGFTWSTYTGRYIFESVLKQTLCEGVGDLQRHRSLLFIVHQTLWLQEKIIQFYWHLHYTATCFIFARELYLVCCADFQNFVILLDCYTWNLLATQNGGREVYVLCAMLLVVHHSHVNENVGLTAQAQGPVYCPPFGSMVWPWWLWHMAHHNFTTVTNYCYYSQRVKNNPTLTGSDNILHNCCL
jgi:hypothetical protein